MRSVCIFFFSFVPCCMGATSTSMTSYAGADIPSMGYFNGYERPWQTIIPFRRRIRLAPPHVYRSEAGYHSSIRPAVSGKLSSIQAG
jgi:hypothetical protein